MTITPPSIPEALNRHLSTHTETDAPSLAHYLDRGAALITPDAVEALRALRQPLQTKIDALTGSERLRQRLQVLATYFDETNHFRVADHARRDVAFALFYFLKGFDRIPDTVPEVGLLDDALMVDFVLQRHFTTLRVHWLRHRRLWPAKL